jgi:NAD(P)-dependent dehydrogenase (short-subunit alcohol dehydrogenase family)
MALALARAGWQVAVHYRDSRDQAMQTVAACAELAGDSAAFDADFFDEESVRSLVPRVVERFGRIDAVVNNASLFEHDDAQSFSYVALEAHLRSNTGAPILLSQALHAHVQERVAAGEESAHGAVVNVLDQKLWNQNPDFLSYTLSKAPWKPPTPCWPWRWLHACAWWAWRRADTDQPYAESGKSSGLHAMSPLGRSSSPEDIAAAVCFALENRSMTGTTMLVDGGQHLQRFERDFSMM